MVGPATAEPLRLRGVRSRGHGRAEALRIPPGARRCQPDRAHGIPVWVPRSERSRQDDVVAGRRGPAAPRRRPALRPRARSVDGRAGDTGRGRVPADGPGFAGADDRSPGAGVLRATRRPSTDPARRGLRRADAGDDGPRATDSYVLARHAREKRIVQAVQHDPRLLLLDEPTEGLDPLVQEGSLRS